MRASVNALAAALFSVSACTTVPTPHYTGENKPTVDALITHIRCEIRKSGHIQDLAARNYVASIVLTLKIENGNGISPNLSFISAPTFAYAVDGNANLDKQQSFTTSYTLDMAKVGNSRCDDVPYRDFLLGDLKITDIIDNGFKVEPAFDVDAGKDKVLTWPTFGSTTMFTITYGWDTGPTWTLAGFKGPNGSKGILNGSLINTDTLVIGFAPPKELTAKAADHALLDLRAGSLRDRAVDLARQEDEAASRDSAVTAAQQLTTTMILQNLAASLH